MSRSLPLFQDLEPPEPGPGGDGSVTRRGGGAGDSHLRAARRLSRAMWRYPEHSAEQTRVGLAICRHLQALLAETREPPPP